MPMDTKSWQVGFKERADSVQISVCQNTSIDTLLSLEIKLSGNAVQS